jgi:hypothetical protein
MVIFGNIKTNIFITMRNNFDVNKWNKERRLIENEQDKINEFISTSKIFGDKFNDTENKIYKLSVKWAANKNFNGFDETFKKQLRTLLIEFGEYCLNKGEKESHEDTKFLSNLGN